MTSSIILKKSSVASRVPVVSDLAYGELALNYADGALYYKRSDNTIQNLIPAGGTGTVTSVGISVPMGLSVSNTPITSSGTIAISLAAGYSIPTIASQTNWDTAYGWGNHASAGYLLSSTAASTYQPLDDDLTAIAGIAGTSGLLKKTAANTWTLDSNTYLTANQSITVSGDATGSGTTSIALTLANTTVTAGSYTLASITVDSKGRITGASSGSAVSSFNTRTGAIALTSGDVTDALTYTPFSSAGGTISGNVLISVTAGATPPLDVNHVGTLTYGLRVGDTATVTNNTGIYLRTTSTATVAWGAGGELVFATSGGSVTRFAIGSSGQWGIGASEDFGLSGQVYMSQGATAAPVWKLPGTRVTTLATGTSITLNCDTTDLAKQVNTQAAGTLTINAPTGTPVDGQRIMLRLTSTNVQTFSWNAIFAGSTDMVLPTASTGGGKEDYFGFIYDSDATKWHLIAKSFGY